MIDMERTAHFEENYTHEAYRRTGNCAISGDCSARGIFLIDEFFAYLSSSGILICDFMSVLLRGGVPICFWNLVDAYAS